MKRYMIYCCAGTGGLFLTSVFAQVLGYPTKAIFSDSGHAHNMGRGNWRGSKHVCFIGNHWQLSYRPGQPLYYSHVVSDDFLQQNPDIELVLISADQDDYKKITELMVKKAWPDIWNQEEYNKWAGPNYPPYSPDNIPQSEIIVNDLIADLRHSIIEQWFKINQNRIYNYAIDFKTIMGINDINLVDTVCDIVGKSAAEDTRKYVLEYQTLNKKLYFNHRD